MSSVRGPLTVRQLMERANRRRSPTFVLRTIKANYQWDHKVEWQLVVAALNRMSRLYQREGWRYSC